MSDELARMLRELAARHQPPPPVDPAEIRARAQRRGRRRRASAALGVTTVAACALTVAAALTPPAEDVAPTRRVPATAPDTSRTPTALSTSPGSTSPGSTSPRSTPPRSTSSSPPVADLLDVNRLTLTVGDRVMRVDPQYFAALRPGRDLMVAAKYDVLPPSAYTTPKGLAKTKIPYVVELRGDGESPVYVGALPAGANAASTIDGKTGWVGLTSVDAEWFYARVRKGDHIRVVASVAAGTSEPTAGAADRVPGSTDAGSFADGG
ncbi:hypothetical protein [Streptomyces cadmiisoli]|uniref:hypothetical protein n=1 Tax=Streptomyces cadmiisoli TaxID=2184053 RepID=UPI003D708E9F